ncbi:hypothetical protein MHN79_11505 [Vibrio sp. Of14-4]|uniref:hypothetical protein n=1 Tax=Vibrio sp. Of14-4 TaxID=2724878 RepID=UPI001EF2640B|nr:hypothetical protein [Vibrio sp. Of14-4]MCG7490118.1 hypothetical protein [Vibrio sp. Of14-4]
MNNHILPISASDHSTISSDSAPEKSYLNAEVIQQTEKGFDQIDLILALMNRLAMNSKQLILLLLLVKLKTSIILTILSNIPDDPIALSLLKGLKELAKKLEGMTPEEGFEFDSQITLASLNSFEESYQSRALTDREVDETNSIILQLEEVQKTIKYWLQGLST